MFDPLYSCADNDFRSALKNDEYYYTDLKSVFDAPGVAFDVDSTPETYTDVVWNNLPVNVNATVLVQTKLSGVDASEWSNATLVEATKPY